MRVRREQRGFVVIALSVAMVLLLAFVGLAFDFGRVHIARNEAQVYTDAAALTAASRLDGTLSGVQKAREAVSHLPGKWNLGTQPFTGVVVEFSSDGTHWTDTPEKSTGTWSQARVTAPANDLDIVFLRAAGGPNSLRILSRSAAQSNPVRLTE
jgi:Flp pilus assembly protein TadG